MNFKRFYRRESMLAFSLIILVSCRKVEQHAPAFTIRPNIILILGDDVGYELLTCDGGESYLTPALDNLAHQGMRFTQCHACPNCSPTRIELLTGKYGFRNYTGWGILDPSQKTLANMLQNAGYKTCVAGKWQLGGGDASIRGFGFDKYLVFEPFFVTNEAQENKHRYKDPTLYESGSYLPTTITSGKYADDLFADYIGKFIDSNLSSPFFIYFPLSLCHQPFSPTPDDPEFNTWDPSTDHSDRLFFPSMVKYMDKKVQQVVDKVNTAGLSNKTIIIFIGDNGSSFQITSMFNGQELTGGKGTSTVYGTHVPLIINWPGSVLPNVSDALIDPSDFLPTLAALAKINEPANYGILDGIAFNALLTGATERLRDWIYCYWNPENRDPIFRVWVQDEKYKLYDSTNQHFFFNLITDPMEQQPVADDQLNVEEQAAKTKFEDILGQMHN